jgi:hypothetical protein
MNNRADIVQEIILLIKEHEPNVTYDAMFAVETRVREKWGGQEVYIGKLRGGLNLRAAQRLGDAETIRRRLNVSARYARQLLKKIKSGTNSP